MKRATNARIWIFENDGPIKLTLKPGQALKWSKSGPTEEGWSSEGFTLEWDGHELVQHWFSDGTDCDGRLSQSGSLVTTPDKFYAREPYRAEDYQRYRDLYGDSLAGVKFPEWEKFGRDRQRDYTAEAMGY